MEFLEKMIIEHYKFVLVFLVLITCTFRYLIKRQQLSNEYLIRSQELSNEQLAIQISNKNRDVKTLHLKDSKILIKKHDESNVKNLKNDPKTKESELTVAHRKKL